MGTRSPPHNLQQQQQQQQQQQMASYSQSGSSHGQVPTTLWMVTNPGNQISGADSSWPFPSLSGTSTAAMFRGSMSSGLHFMNFPAPMALMPSQQLGLSSGVGGGEAGQLSMLAALNAYRPLAGGGGSTGGDPAGTRQASQHGGVPRFQRTPSNRKWLRSRNPCRGGKAERGSSLDLLRYPCLLLRISIDSLVMGLMNLGTEAEAIVLELWLVEEYDILALALDGRMKVRKFRFSCSSNEMF
ncbi:hypothetical protein J5N97_017214 [Dioscorea zingiberensis]|uniref:Uncharacterized protein n=1 Tax=Dioscorea zingiberensis TaxID=325984 RepID=A0A9D5CLX9_9LILI|nr:hypothetical protein J5N97_017214 [Dioscorea zingiberensis]